MPQVRITDSSGAVRARIPLVRCVWEETGLNVNQLGRVTVSRNDLNALAALEPGGDRVYVEEGGVDLFGGVLRTPGRNGGKPELLVDGFSEYADRAEPVQLGQEKVGVDDSAMITEVVDATPQLASGTVQTVESGLTFIFSGVSQRDKARKVAEAAGGELVFNSDRTVDYVDQRGSDKTSTTLSPSNGSFVENTFVVDRDAKHGRTTHLKVYGAGEGSHQIEATVVPDDDSASYPNKATYTNPNWSAGDEKIWDGFSNKDVKRADTAQSWGQTLAGDLQDTEVRVETVVKGDEVRLGDRFHVSHPEEGVDEDLRAVEVTTVIDAEGGTRYETVFSNYSVGHFDTEIEDHRDTGRYNLAFEGDLNRINDSPGRGPVGPSNDYAFAIDYPDDVQYEVDAEIQIVGQNYRSFHAGAASGGEHSHPVPINITTAEGAGDAAYSTPGFQRSQLQDGETFTDTFSLPSVTGDAAYAHIYFSIQAEVDDNPDGSSGAGTAEITNQSTFNTIYSESLGPSYSRGRLKNIQVSQTGNVEGDTIEVAFEDTSASTQEIWYTFSYGAIVFSEHAHLVDDSETATADGDHTHQPLPGIIDFAEYPSNVDVVINGSSMGESIGNGLSGFETTVDVTGELSQGWNDIRLTSDTIGHLDATFSADLYRQKL